jgi:hypothetical protein
MEKLVLSILEMLNISKKRLKCQEDCNVPAIGQMNGCVTTESGYLVTRNSWAVTLKMKKRLK